jgi:hypothetical protein
MKTKLKEISLIIENSLLFKIIGLKNICAEKSMLIFIFSGGDVNDDELPIIFIFFKILEETAEKQAKNFYKLKII